MKILCRIHLLARTFQIILLPDSVFISSNRSAFDLTQHSNATGIRLTAEKKLPAPVTKDITEIVPNKAAIGKVFKKEAKDVTTMLSQLSLEQIEKVEKDIGSGETTLEFNGKDVQFNKE